MFYNDRFTPSRDSTNVHTLRLLSPFPHRPSQILLFSSPGVSRWQALWRCECVCLPLTLVTHILSGVTHTDWIEIDLRVKGLQCASVCVHNTDTHAIFNMLCVHSCAQQVSVCARVCVGQFVYSSDCMVHSFLSLLLPTRPKTTPLHTQTSKCILLTSTVLNKEHSLIPYILQATSSSLCIPPWIKLSTKSWHKEAPTRKSAQKKSEGVSICPVSVQHLIRQLSQPCDALYCTVCVCTHQCHVQYCTSEDRAE